MPPSQFEKTGKEFWISAKSIRRPVPADRLGYGLSAGAIELFARWYEARGLRREKVLGTRLDRVLQAAAGIYAIGRWPLHVRILEALLVHRQGYWVNEEWRERRSADGLRMRLNISDHFQRWDYFFGRYHEFEVSLGINALLQPGDVFIDGGANAGLLTMQAAARVGPRGRVIACEPNPSVFEQLKWHVETNALHWVSMQRVGLSNEPGEAEVRVPGRWNLGAATFAPLPARYKGEVFQSAAAPLIRGDDLCADLPETAAVVIKLDIEGFEAKALAGFEKTLDRFRPAVVCEVNPEMLEMAGDTPEELVQRMTRRGYVAYSPQLLRKRVRWRHLKLVETDWTGRIHRDVIWVHPESAFWDRLRPFIRAGEP